MKIEKIEINTNRHKVCVAQLGARMHYAVPRILNNSSQLERLYTDIYAASYLKAFELLPKSLMPKGLKRLLGRIPDGIPSSQITSFPKFGLDYSRRLVKARGVSEKNQHFLWAGKYFCDLILRGGFGKASAIYTFNTASLELLQAARMSGLFAVMEQTIAPHALERKILTAEHHTHPGWQEHVSEDLFATEIEERERNEWNNADLIICGSNFVKEGISKLGGPVEKCRVIPYGINSIYQAHERRLKREPLKVLTVGEVGLRKGTPYILKAAQLLKDKINIRMVGQINVLPKAELELRKYIELVGSIPRSEIHKQFLWADVFLLPSLCEGSATVVYEALGFGLPVICTENTGSVVRNGIEGFIVEIQNGESIAEKLEKISNDHYLYDFLSKNARRRFEEYNFKNYSENIQNLFEIKI